MSILLHVSVRRNLASIWKLGISPAFSQGERAECWFCSRSKRPWAVAHVAERRRAAIGSDRLPGQHSPLPVGPRRRGVWTCTTVVKSIVSVAVPAAAA